MHAILTVVEVWCAACEACANMTAGESSAAPVTRNWQAHEDIVGSANHVRGKPLHRIARRVRVDESRLKKTTRVSNPDFDLCRLWARESDGLDPRQTVENVDSTCQVIEQIAGKTEIGDLSQLSSHHRRARVRAGHTPRATLHSTVRASKRRTSKA